MGYAFACLVLCSTYVLLAEQAVQWCYLHCMLPDCNYYQASKSQLPLSLIHGYRCPGT